MFGKVQLEEFKELSSMPQSAASDWTAATAGLVGATYKPILYVGWQIANGVNHIFIAEQNIMANPTIRRLVTVVVNGGQVVHAEEIL